MAKKKAEEPEENIDFEGSLRELESIVRRLEQGSGGLDDALQDYAQAIVLMRACTLRLESAERKIEILSGVDAEGNPITRAMNDEELSLEDKQSTRDKRRGANKSSDSSGPGGSLF
jgi:exodeoxyribonuclease VII small subunit